MQLYGSDIFSAGIWHCITWYLVPNVFKTNVILDCQIQLHVVVNSCNCMPLYTWPNPCSRVLLQKLTGPQIFKKFLTIHGIQGFITMITTALHTSLSWPDEASQHSRFYFFKIHFNIILTFFPCHACHISHPPYSLQSASSHCNMSYINSPLWLACSFYIEALWYNLLNWYGCTSSRYLFKNFQYLVKVIHIP